MFWYKPLDLAEILEGEQQITVIQKCTRMLLINEASCEKIFFVKSNVILKVSFFSSTNLLAGDDGSGKTTLMAKIQGAEHGKKGRGLEYLYLNIHDEDRDGKFVSNAISLIK